MSRKSPNKRQDGDGRPLLAIAVSARLVVPSASRDRVSSPATKIAVVAVVTFAVMASGTHGLSLLN